MQVGPYNFPMIDYYRFADSVYLGPESGGGESGDLTPEGHAFLYPDGGGDEIIGLELQGVSRQLEQDGEVAVTLPSGEKVRLPVIERLIEENREVCPSCKGTWTRPAAARGEPNACNHRPLRALRGPWDDPARLGGRVC